MSETISFGLDDFPQIDVREGSPVSIKIEGKVVSRSGNAVEVEVSTKDVQTENKADKEYRELSGAERLETAEGAVGAGDQVDW